MPVVTLVFDSKTEPVREKIERELTWYDAIRQEMLIFKGGQLDFEYKEDPFLVAMGSNERNRRGIRTTFRMLPKVEELEVVNYNKSNRTTNSHKVKKWFDNYVNYNVTNVAMVDSNNDGLVVNVPDGEMDDFLYQAERAGLRTDF